MKPLLVCTDCFATMGELDCCPVCTGPRERLDGEPAVTLRRRAETELVARSQQEYASVMRVRSAVLVVLCVAIAIIAVRNWRVAVAALWAVTLGSAFVANLVLRRRANASPRSGSGIQRRRAAARYLEDGPRLTSNRGGAGLLTRREAADVAILSEIAASFDPATAPIEDVADWLHVARTA